MKMKGIALILLLVLLSGCGILRPSVTIIKDNFKNYKFVYVPSTQSLQSSSSYSFGSVSYPYSKSVNPRDVIAGRFSKYGFVIVNSLEDRFRKETIIVNYGQSGKRDLLFGYALEVTLQIQSAETGELLATVSAEGKGSTEADDIREAITRAVDALFNNE